MHRAIFLSCVLTLILAGCSERNSSTTRKDDPSKATDQAQAYSKDWASMGMWLPDSKQLAFFANNIDVTKRVLIDKLGDPNDDVRQRAAYVIEQIGPVASATQTALVAALAKEKVPLVRIYLCNALRAVGGSNEEALAQLRSLYRASGDDKDTIDQRIYAAAALATLSKNQQEVKECTDFVCGWLKPPDKKLTPSELEKYSDIRWSAVNAVEHMAGAQQAIPLLEKMLADNEKPAWVDVHVPRALAALKGEPAPQTKQGPTNQSNWVPPAQPDPQKILSEAQADMIGGRYAESLAKLVWFHNNSLQIDPALYGVRLSFALSYWKQLAQVYPPAKAKLTEVRDEAEKKLVGNEDTVRFHAFVALNSALDDHVRTVTAFKALAQKSPEAAAKVYDAARPDLIRAGEIKLCSRYVDAKVDYPRLVEMYRMTEQTAKDAKLGEMRTNFAQQSFSNGVATLVALLAVSDRKSEAERIAAEAKRVWDDEAFAAELDKALKGQVPPPWPPSI